jgi:hypothetical protein
VTTVSGVDNGVTECAFCVSAREECLSDETQLGGIANLIVWFVGCEAFGEFVGAIENLLCGAGHGGHLKYLGRAGMA